MNEDPMPPNAARRAHALATPRTLAGAGAGCCVSTGSATAQHSGSSSTVLPTQPRLAVPTNMHAHPRLWSPTIRPDLIRLEARVGRVIWSRSWGEFYTHTPGAPLGVINYAPPSFNAARPLQASREYSPNGKPIIRGTGTSATAAETPLRGAQDVRPPWLPAANANARRRLRQARGAAAGGSPASGTREGGPAAGLDLSHHPNRTPHPRRPPLPFAKGAEAALPDANGRRAGRHQEGGPLERGARTEGTGGPGGGPGTGGGHTAGLRNERARRFYF